MSILKTLKERDNSLFNSDEIVKDNNLKLFHNNFDDLDKNSIIKKIIEIIKYYIFLSLEKIDEIKIYIYIPFFIIFFLLYNLITVPTLFKKNSNNLDDEKSNKIKFYIVLSADIIFLILIIVLFICYSLYTEKIKNNQPLFITIILLPILLSAILFFFTIYYIGEYLEKASNSVILKYIFIVLSIIFNILFFILFTYNIYNEINIEFFITLLLLSLFLVEYIISSISGLKSIYYKLMNSDYSILTVNCINPNNIEKYTDLDNNSISNQITEIKKKYGDTYLKTIGNIPISFYNKNIKDYQDLTLNDFYYPGSYYTYLANSPFNGSPNLDAIKIAIDTFKCRIIHLDIYSDNSDPYDPNSNPIVKCENMKTGSEPLNFEDVLSIIKKSAWNTNDPNNLSYPFFLYMNFKFNNNQNIYIKIYNSLLKFFSKNLVDKKYSFAGRNSTFSISKAKITECLNKIIIITNTYPTKSILDELINVSTNTLNNNLNLLEYKESYIKFDKIGVSQDNDKTTLLNSSKNNMNIYYSKPNEKNKDNNQDKAGLFNPSFQDCAQYGIQATLMYVFVPDDNLKKWNAFFKNKNNLDPVLKDELLRTINGVPVEIVKQNPVVGLQKPQKYCVVPGLMATEKSNLSDGVENSSCNDT